MAFHNHTNLAQRFNELRPLCFSAQRKKPWRYRWPDDFRDEVLARLLELNEQRHKEELLAGSSESVAGSKKKKTTKTKATKGVGREGQTNSAQNELF